MQCMRLWRHSLAWLWSFANMRLAALCATCLELLLPLLCKHRRRCRRLRLDVKVR